MPGLHFSKEMFYLMYSYKHANLSVVGLITFRRLALAIVLWSASLSAQVYAAALPVVTFPEQVLRAIADPNIALLLVVLGALGIYAEFCAPGLLAPGVIGSIFLFLGLTALSRLPIRWTGVSIMILGLTLCVLGARWPTRGIFTGGGALALALGAARLIDTAGTGLRIRWSTAIALSIPFALATSLLLAVAIRARRNKSICV
jgi:membrane-bound serine protease (ClpP class)